MRKLLSETKLLKAQYEHYFLREYRFRYWLLVVDNHFFNRYYFFLEKQKQGTALLHSHELLALEHDSEKYQQVLKELKQFSKLRIQYRNTHQLVHPTKDIISDRVHGHG